jgi:hypothetical protein
MYGVLVGGTGEGATVGGRRVAVAGGLVTVGIWVGVRVGVIFREGCEGTIVGCGVAVTTTVTSTISGEGNKPTVPWAPVAEGAVVGSAIIDAKSSPTAAAPFPMRGTGTGSRDSSATRNGGRIIAPAAARNIPDKGALARSANPAGRNIKPVNH